LPQHLLVAAGERAQDELGDARLHIGRDALDDGLGVADGEVGEGVLAGALLVLVAALLSITLPKPEYAKN